MSVKIIRNVAKEVSQATKKLKDKNKGIALGLSKNKGKTIKVEVLQQRIRQKAKAEGMTVKNYRMQNANDPDVKALYKAKPFIKSGDDVRGQVRVINKARDKKSALENKYYNEAEAKFKKEGKKFRKDYFAEDLDDYVDSKMEQNHKIIVDASKGKAQALERFSKKDYRKGGMVRSTVDYLKNK